MDRNTNDFDKKTKKEDQGYEEDFPEDLEVDEYMMAEALEYRDLWIRRIIFMISVILTVVLAMVVLKMDSSEPGNTPTQSEPSSDFLVVSVINEEGVLVSHAISEYLKVDLLDEKNAETVPSQFLTQSERWDKQVPVILHLSAKNARALYYKIELADNPNFSHASVDYLYDFGGLYELENLYANTQYYYRITVYTKEGEDTETGSFTTADTPRSLSIDGLYFVRDIGNWMTADGKRIKQGLLIRGTEMDGAVESDSHLTNEGLMDMLDVLGIRMDMDLREHKSEMMDALGSRVEHKYYDMVMYDGIFTEEGKEKIREVFADLANPDNYPIYLHCTYGRDRTGTVCYLLEALLGVSAEDCLKEYGLSNAGIKSIKKVENGLKAYEGNTLQEQTEAYLLSCGVTEAQIRSIRNIFLGD